MSTDSLDRDRIEKLLVALLVPIRDNYLKGPMPDRDRVYEALNALAGASALVISGCDDPGAADFFIKALNQQMGITVEVSSG